MKIAPDLVWLVDGEVRACIDVKYKIEKHGQYPNADLYQIAAYCRRFGLQFGHLIYAVGESRATHIRLIDGPQIEGHTFRLSGKLAQTGSQADTLVDQIVRSSARRVYR